MKTVAIARNVITKEEFEITAHKAYELRERNFAQFKEHVFISFKTEEPVEMFVVKRSHCFFRYKSNPDIISKDSDNESLKHKIAKEEISKLSTLILNKGGDLIEVVVNASNTLIEKRLSYEGKIYEVDLFFEIIRTEPKKYFYKWGGILALEIHVNHKVDPIKKNDLISLGIPVFETKLSKKIIREFKAEKFFDDADIIAMRERFAKMFKKNIYGELISNPSRKEYLEMVNYEKQIKIYKEKLSELKKIYNTNKSIVEKFLEENNDVLEFKDKVLYLEEECQQLKKKVNEYEMKALNINKYRDQEALKMKQEIYEKNILIEKYIKEIRNIQDKYENNSFFKRVKKRFKKTKN